MTRLLCVRLGAGPSSATLVNLHIVRRVALSQANIWSSERAEGVCRRRRQYLFCIRDPPSGPDRRGTIRNPDSPVARGRPRARPACAQNSKTGAKLLHLSPPAVEILEKLLRPSANEFVFVGGKEGRLIFIRA
jgi:hypothetical protein